MMTAYGLVCINILCNTGALPKILFMLTLRVLQLAPLSGRLQHPLECLPGELVGVLSVEVPADTHKYGTSSDLEYHTGNKNTFET